MKARLYGIVAVCDDWGIGRAGDMVVANRQDMKHFVELTRGHTVIMGRRTLESLPGAQPLADRRNIVLTRTLQDVPQGIEVVHTIDEAIAALAPHEEAWVIGGAQIYRQFLPYMERLEVTHNHVIHPADAFFPNVADDPAWEVISRSGLKTVQEGEGDCGLTFEFVTYTRNPLTPTQEHREAS